MPFISEEPTGRPLPGTTLLVFWTHLYKERIQSREGHQAVGVHWGSTITEVPWVVQDSMFSVRAKLRSTTASSQNSSGLGC